LTIQTKNPLAGALIEIALTLAEMRGRRIVEQAAFRRAVSTLISRSSIRFAKCVEKG
jgi:hypothetical protein